MGATENSIEMEEKKPLSRGGNSSTKDSANDAAIEIDENVAVEGAKAAQVSTTAEVGLEKELYRFIVAILIPYIIIGCPFNFCLDKTSKNIHKLMASRCMKAYTCLISLFAHSILIFWIVRSGWHMSVTKHLNDDIIKDLWRLSYISAGVVSLDLIWIFRKNIMEVLSNLQDNCALSTGAKHQALFAENICTLKGYRIRFSVLLVLSHLLAVLLFIYYSVLAFSIIRAYTDSDPEGYLHWWSTAVEVVTLYALFFFASNAILLLSLLWAMQYKIKHLNLYIRNLIKHDQQPDVSDIEIVKSWYQGILKTVSSIDRVFAFYTLVFVGLLFLGIIYFVSQLVDIFKTGGVENAHFMSIFGGTLLMALILFYFLEEFADLHQNSSSTKSILFDYVLETKPEERSTQFFEEINFVTQGLLSKAACFTLLGQIELNKSFLVHLVLVIYSYTVLFHQFTQKIK